MGRATLTRGLLFFRPADTRRVGSSRVASKYFETSRVGSGRVGSKGFEISRVGSGRVMLREVRVTSWVGPL